MSSTERRITVVLMVGCLLWFSLATTISGMILWATLAAINFAILRKDTRERRSTRTHQ